MALKPIIPPGLYNSSPRSSGPLAKFITNAVASQSIAAGGFTKLVLDADPSINIGGFWDKTTSKWTPSAGVYYIGFATPCDLNTWEARIYKNGADASHLIGVVTCVALSAGTVFQANGTDYFEFYIQNDGATPFFIYSSDGRAQFFGFQLP